MTLPPESTLSGSAPEAPAPARVRADSPAGGSAEKVTLPILHFDQGLPGFSDARRFVVVPMEEALRPFCRMMSIDEEGLQFVVVPPGPLFPDYQIEVDEDTVDKLGFTDSSDVIVLLIVDAKSPPEVPTANLLAPIVFHRKSFAASQVVLHNSSYSAATPLGRPRS